MVNKEDLSKLFHDINKPATQLYMALNMFNNSIKSKPEEEALLTLKEQLRNVEEKLLSIEELFKKNSKILKELNVYDNYAQQFKQIKDLLSRIQTDKKIPTHELYSLSQKYFEMSKRNGTLTKTSGNRT